MLTNADLYDRDLYAWTQEQAALLQAGCFDCLDIPHLVEELQLMGGSERGELANRLIVLLTHLLKLHIAAQHLPMDLAACRCGLASHLPHATPAYRQSPAVQPELAPYRA